MGTAKQKPEAEAPELDIASAVAVAIAAADIAGAVAAAIADADIEGKITTAVGEALDKAITDLNIVDQVDAAIALVDIAGKVSKILDDKDWSEVLAAALQKHDLAQEQARIGAETAATAEQEQRIEERKKADKAQADRLDKQQKDAAKQRQKQAEAARMQFDALINDPFHSLLSVDNCKAISLRFGDGETFHPTIDLDLTAGDLTLENGRWLNGKRIDLASDLAAMTINQAYLICEGEGAPAIYASRIEPPLNIGEGRAAHFGVGALAFAMLNGGQVQE